jgi:hypothetical protein
LRRATKKGATANRFGLVTSHRIAIKQTIRALSVVNTNILTFLFCRNVFIIGNKNIKEKADQAALSYYSAASATGSSVGATSSESSPTTTASSSVMRI